MKQALHTKEFLWGAIILIAGMTPRVLFGYHFPSKPISDFRAINDFAIAFSRDIFANNIAWRSFSPGLPLFLSILIRLFPTLAPEDIGRWSTIVLSGLMPLLPYMIWKNVFAPRVRITAGLLLALWPSQILFSTVIAQDNWVIPPTIALCCLAVRILKGNENGKPVLGAVLYFLTLFIRQEMLVVVLPAAFVVIMGSQPKTRIKNLLLGGIVITTLLTLMIFHRGQSTGRYTISSAHIGRSMLGSYVPGAGLGWEDPSAYLAAVNPDLLDQLNTDFNSAQDKMVGIAIGEFSRRTRFHLFRISGATLYNMFDGTGNNIYWSLTGPDAITPEQLDQAQFVVKSISPSLNLLTLIAHLAFITSILFFLRNKKILLLLPVLLVIALKIVTHAILVITARYFLVIFALEFLVIALISDELVTPTNWRAIIQPALISLVLVFGIYLYPYPKMLNYIRTHDETDIQRTYRFPMVVAGGADTVIVHCDLKKGWLELKGSQEASIAFLNSPLRRGDKAVANCHIQTSRPSSIILSLFDPYESNQPLTGIYQIVSINDMEVIRRDIADTTGENWIDIPLQVDTSMDVTIELTAENPESGSALLYRNATKTRFFFKATE